MIIPGLNIDLDLPMNAQDLPCQDHLYTLSKREGLRLHLVGLGDVGGTFLTGLRLKANTTIGSIGIYDTDRQKCRRYEQEINQIHLYDEPAPVVEILTEEQLFDCDVFVFAVAVAVPSIEEGKAVDVRMVQLSKNKQIILHYSKLARKQGFKGLFAVLSDPVDPLCQAAFLHSNQNEEGIWDGKGLCYNQIRGFGLGVMNARATYFADQRYPAIDYRQKGRAYGPHGKALIIANDPEHYDPAISEELTHLAETANLQVRELGFKPYIAPALSSGVISLLRCLRGQWHYSSVFMGGIYFGTYNRLTDQRDEIEEQKLAPALVEKIKATFQMLIEQSNTIV